MPIGFAVAHHSAILRRQLWRRHSAARNGLSQEQDYGKERMSILCLKALAAFHLDLERGAEKFEGASASKRAGRAVADLSR